MYDGVLVIGATGFIGRSIVPMLSSIFDKVYTISRRESCFDASLKINHHRCSLDNVVILKKILKKCNVVIHLASETNPGTSILQPYLEATNNLLPSLRFLECLQEFPHVILVYVSTGGAIYGDVDMAKVPESIPLSPLSYYGAGKAALEKFIGAFSRQAGNTTIILRPSNIYGPGQYYRKGFGIIPTIFEKILKKEDLHVWGDGKIIRDYLYIDDFVSFFKILIKNIFFEKSINIYNVGSSAGLSLNDLILIIENKTKNKLNVVYQRNRKIDVKSIVLDCSLAINKFVWRANTSIEKGIEKTWDWYRLHRI